MEGASTPARRRLEDEATDDLERADAEAAVRLSRLQLRRREVAGPEVSDASGPFTPEINGAVTRAFDRDVSHLTATFGDAESTKALRAAAYTRGTHMVFGPEVRQDPSDARSMEIIGHEVAHALGGGGARPGVDRQGDGAEPVADAAGRHLADSIARRGGGPGDGAARPAAGVATVHRMSVGGPGGMKDAVHETLTVETLVKAGLVPPGTKLWDPATIEYLRGVYWNDDPEALQFGDALSRPDGAADFSTGFAWLMRFLFGDRERSLTARSHHGDLQFLHAMAGKNGEPPDVTKKNIALWVRFTIEVATGKIAGRTPVGKTILAPLFQGDLGEMDVYTLFAVTDGDARVLRQRATGSLLHVIQDSHAHGHTERDHRGEIVEFHSYGEQDHGEHGEYDNFHGGEASSASVPGGGAAVDHGAATLRLLIAGNVEATVAYVLDEVLALAEDARPAGPGDELRKHRSVDVERVEPPVGFVVTRRDRSGASLDLRAELQAAGGATITFLLAYGRDEDGRERWSLYRAGSLQPLDSGTGFPSTSRVYLEINPILGRPAGTVPGR